MFQNSPDPSEINSGQNYPLQAPCVNHSGSYVTNFCKQTGCLMPLCPKCIPQHLDKHRQQGQYAELVTVDEMHEETQQLIKNQLGSLNQAVELLNKFKDSKSDAHGQLHEKLNNAKQNIQRIMDTYFNDLFTDLDTVTKADKSSLDQELQQMERSLFTKIQEYQQIDQKLRTPKYLKQIIQLQTSNFIEQTQQQRVECEAFIEEVSKHTLDISIDPQQLYLLNLQLAQYASIKNAEYYRQQTLEPVQKPGHYNHPYLTSNISDVGSKIEQSPYKKLEQQFQQVATQFTINLPDFYEPLCNQKFLHYFTDKSVFILNLDWVTNPNQPNWQEIKLSCQVPLRSTTVRSQQGEIFVIGGYIGNQLSSQIYRLDLKQQTLVSNDSLSIPRHSASGVFVQNKLYVLGGSNQTEELNSIELLEIALSKSKVYNETKVILPKMQQGGSNLSVCSFRQYIIKAAPVEIFDTRLIRWTTLNTSISKGVGMIAINNSNILIFGNGQYQLLKMIDQNNLQFTTENLQNNAPQVGNVQNGSLIHLAKIYGIGNNNRLIIGSPEGWIL